MSSQRSRRQKDLKLNDEELSDDDEEESTGLRDSAKDLVYKRQNMPKVLDYILRNKDKIRQELQFKANKRNLTFGDMLKLYEEMYGKTEAAKYQRYIEGMEKSNMYDASWDENIQAIQNKMMNDFYKDFAQDKISERDPAYFIYIMLNLSFHGNNDLVEVLDKTNINQQRYSFYQHPEKLKDYDDVIKHYFPDHTQRDELKQSIIDKMSHPKASLSLRDVMTLFYLGNKQYRGEFLALCKNNIIPERFAKLIDRDNLDANLFEATNDLRNKINAFLETEKKQDKKFDVKGDKFSETTDNPMQSFCNCLLGVISVIDIYHKSKQAEKDKDNSLNSEPAAGARSNSEPGAGYGSR